MKNASLKITFLILVILNSVMVFAQDYSFKNYDWKENETTFNIPDQYKNENEIIISKNIKIEIAVVGNNVKQYYLYHEKTFINSDDAIERNNKIYIPFSLNESVVENKARVILKNGKIISLDKNDIKEEIDEEKNIKYNYFAVTGLEKGAVIERFYILQENPELEGKTFKLQGQYPILDLNFELIFPKHLAFKTKSYNGLTNAKLDSEKLEGKSILSISEKDITTLKNDEEYSNWDTQLKIFRYKLDENLNNGSKNIYSYKKFATNIYDRLNTELDKKDLKSIDELCSNITKSNNLQEQIWNIENKIKKTISYNKYFDAKESLSDILKSKQANELDILKLYIAVFKNFQIENQIVFTSDRYKIPFDTDFESYENLEAILFYFPNIKKYITPTENEFRIPLFPAYLANNNGLFIKSKVFAGVAMGIGEINFIEIPGSEITHDVMEITVDFAKDIENPLITNKIAFGGYASLNLQPLKDFVSTDQFNDILKNIAKNYTDETEYKTLTTENDGLDNISKKPFTLTISFDGKDMIQKAGESYLFSVGKVIGKQMELYQKGKRMLPIEIDYPHSYLRKIKIIVPKGITVKNLDKFNMDFKTQINGKSEAAFISKYDKNGDEINVENSEFYNIINYPLEKFDEYKNVINAASDFNKIVLILNK